MKKNTLSNDNINRALLEQIQPIARDLQSAAMTILSHPIAALSTIFYVLIGAIAYGRLNDLAEICAKFVDDEMPEYRSEMTLRQGGSLAAYKNTQIMIDNATNPAPQPQPATNNSPALSELDELWPTEIDSNE